MNRLYQTAITSTVTLTATVTVIVSMVWLGIGSPLQASERASEKPKVRVAVAANFYHTLRALAGTFAESSGTAVSISVGSTGALYAQIINGAPYDLFLSADALRPRLLVEKGFAEAGSQFTYAIGRLVLWSNTPKFRASKDNLGNSDYRHLALANPKVAPYGMAAWRVLEKLQLQATLKPKLVYGTSVAQVHQFVDSGSATFGFVALAQVLNDQRSSASFWEPPQQWLGALLNQDAVLVHRATKNKAARALMHFLRSAAARAVIEEMGYRLPST